MNDKQEILYGAKEIHEETCDNLYGFLAAHIEGGLPPIEDTYRLIKSITLSNPFNIENMPAGTDRTMILICLANEFKSLIEVNEFLHMTNPSYNDLINIVSKQNPFLRNTGIYGEKFSYDTTSKNITRRFHTNYDEVYGTEYDEVSNTDTYRMLWNIPKGIVISTYQIRQDVNQIHGNPKLAREFLIANDIEIDPQLTDEEVVELAMSRISDLGRIARYKEFERIVSIANKGDLFTVNQIMEEVNSKLESLQLTQLSNKTILDRIRMIDEIIIEEGLANPVISTDTEKTGLTKNQRIILAPRAYIDRIIDIEKVKDSGPDGFNILNDILNELSDIYPHAFEDVDIYGNILKSIIRHQEDGTPNTSNGIRCFALPPGQTAFENSIRFVNHEDVQQYVEFKNEVALAKKLVNDTSNDLAIMDTNFLQTLRIFYPNGSKVPVTTLKKSFTRYAIPNELDHLIVKEINGVKYRGVTIVDLEIVNQIYPNTTMLQEYIEEIASLRDQASNTTFILEGFRRTNRTNFNIEVIDWKKLVPDRQAELDDLKLLSSQANGQVDFIDLMIDKLDLITIENADSDNSNDIRKVRKKVQRFITELEQSLLEFDYELPSRQFGEKRLVYLPVWNQILEPFLREKFNTV